MSPLPPRMFSPPNPEPDVLTDLAELHATMQELLAVTANVAAATYYQSKLIQPAVTRVMLDGGAAQIYTFTDDWTGGFDVQALTVVNPAAFPVYVAGNGDPVASGVPFPAGVTRLPLVGHGGSFVIGVKPADIGANQVILFLIRWPLPD